MIAYNSEKPVKQPLHAPSEQPEAVMDKIIDEAMSNMVLFTAKAALGMVKRSKTKRQAVRVLEDWIELLRATV